MGQLPPGDTTASGIHTGDVKLNLLGNRGSTTTWRYNCFRYTYRGRQIKLTGKPWVNYHLEIQLLQVWYTYRERQIKLTYFLGDSWFLSYAPSMGYFTDQSRALVNPDISSSFYTLQCTIGTHSFICICHTFLTLFNSVEAWNITRWGRNLFGQMKTTSKVIINQNENDLQVFFLNFELMFY